MNDIPSFLLIAWMILAFLYNPPVDFRTPVEYRPTSVTKEARNIPMLSNGNQSILLHLPKLEK